MPNWCISWGLLDYLLGCEVAVVIGFGGSAVPSNLMK